MMQERLRLPGGDVHAAAAQGTVLFGRGHAHLWKMKKAPKAMKAKPSAWF